MQRPFEFGADENRSLQVLWEDDDRILCRTWRNGPDGDGRSVLAVLPATERPTPEGLDRLTHEYALRNDLDGAWSLRPLELVRERGRTVLLLADPGGEPLSRLLGQPMEVGRFLRLAVALASALGRLHERGLVHKDVKPSHVVVNCADGQVRLTGFGLASRLPRERQAPEPPEFIAGTLAYMAPEQTGRMNRSIDSRSDLYALGVTFYQILTGTLPFTAADPMEWVHCHIARKPVPPAERLADVPAPISAIIMKLLAKIAEERYQTAASVERDLRLCLVEWEAEGYVEDFPLGQQDAPDRLLVPEKLYGRAREVETLLAAFDRIVKGGAPELVLVSGYSGIGKSAVVHELHKVLVPPRGLFAAGKFDQYKRDIPYTTLAQAFQSLIRPLLGKSDAELGEWRAALLEALGPNGRLIADLVPELKLIIGDQPPVPELPPQDAQRRFQLVFRRFIDVFARPGHPLALFLDDLQWLDAATLDLLEDLLTESELQHLILIGAYRDNEVTASHPLMRKLDAIRDTGGKVVEITLAPLARDHLGQLIADALRCESTRATPLAQLVHEKTGGNPFFAIQFLSSLTEEGLLTFDHGAARWCWDLDRIHAKGYTDNIVDLMVGKLTRLPAETQKALLQLAYLGNIAEITTLSIVLGVSEEQVHAALWPSVRQELVDRLDNAYRFLHDRVQEAAYSLIPEEHRAALHLRLGRALLVNMTADELAEHLFDVANQLNRGAAHLIESGEKNRVATINLQAGRKAKASAAFASASAYFRAGMALFSESDWVSQYGLMFSLWLERAECEFLSSDFETAAQLVGELLHRGASKVDLTEAYRLKVQLHEVKAEYPQALASALACLRLFDIDIPAHPTWEEVQAEYETVWQKLQARPIENLIEMPLMTDPDMLAIMRLLSMLLNAAYYTDFRLFCMYLCRLLNISLLHGMSPASTHAYGWLGNIAGAVFHRYHEGYSLARLACDLVEKHGFIAYQARVHLTMNTVAIWTQPIAIALESTRMSFRAAVATGDLTYACYSIMHTIADLLLRNDPLTDVWLESERGLDFVRKARYRDIADTIVVQQRFIATMRGRTATFSTFSDSEFDEAAFEAQLTSERMTTMVCYYWILKLKARFLSSDYGEAFAAADQAKALLWSVTGQIYLLDYFYYTALTAAALFEKASVHEQIAWRALLTSHCEQLCEWAQNYPPSFGDKYALVSAEIARLDGRELDAERLYEQAIRLARENGFVQNEGVANELAARFYAARGFETIAPAYLRNARYCYLRWGAAGKLRQLDELHPNLGEEESAPDSQRTIGATIEHLDLATVIKVSQTVSGEIVLEKLIDTLLRTAVEHAGAERGLLVLPQGGQLWIRAEATTSGSSVTIDLRDAPISNAELPGSVIRYALRTQESVILDDASARGAFSGDEYICRRAARSVLCLPLMKQGTPVALLYLENNLAPHVFTPSRIAVLKLLASEAATSLENSRLYRELQEREARIRRLVDANIIGIFIWSFDGRITDANEAFLRIVGYDRDDLVSGRLRWRELTPAEWRDADDRRGSELRATGTSRSYEKEYFHKSGKRVPVLIGAAKFEESRDEGVAFVLDLTDRKKAEAAVRESERRYREIETELAHANRIATMGQLTGSIAHEVSQPIAASMTNAQAALNWLERQPPDLERVRRLLARIVEDDARAGQVVDRTRALIKKAPPQRVLLEIDGLIGEVIALTRSEAMKNGIFVKADFAEGLPCIRGDRVQLQQVALNLIINAIQAMSDVREGARELAISTEKTESGGVLVVVRDSGPGLVPADGERVFDAFYTTKTAGLGMGLSISRSIIEAHGGRLWASRNEPRGAVFQFILPPGEKTGVADPANLGIHSLTHLGG